MCVCVCVCVCVCERERLNVCTVHYSTFISTLKLECLKQSISWEYHIFRSKQNLYLNMYTKNILNFTYTKRSVTFTVKKTAAVVTGILP